MLLLSYNDTFLNNLSFIINSKFNVRMNLWLKHQDGQWMIFVISILKLKNLHNYRVIFEHGIFVRIILT